MIRDQKDEQMKPDTTTSPGESGDRVADVHEEEMTSVILVTAIVSARSTLLSGP